MRFIPKDQMDNSDLSQGIRPGGRTRHNMGMDNDDYINTDIGYILSQFTL